MTDRPIMLVPTTQRSFAEPAYQIYRDGENIEYLFSADQLAAYEAAVTERMELDAQLYPLRDEYMRLLAEVRRQQALCNDALTRILSLSLDVRHTSPAASAGPSALEALRRMLTLLGQVRRVRGEFNALQAAVRRNARQVDTLAYTGRAQRASLRQYVIPSA
jgi:hypothetical protein